MPENLPYPGDPNYLPMLAEYQKIMQELMDLQTAGVTLTPEQQAAWDEASANANAMVQASFVEGSSEPPPIDPAGHTVVSTPAKVEEVKVEDTARDKAIAKDPGEQFKEGGKEPPPAEVAPTYARDTGLISDKVEKIFAEDAMKQKKQKAQEEDGVKTLTVEEINAAN